MRELSFEEVALIHGGFTPMEWLIGIGFVGLTVSYSTVVVNTISTSTTAIGTAKLGGVALGLCYLGWAVSVSAAIGAGFLLVMGYTTCQGAYSSNEPVVVPGHNCLG